MLITRLPEDVLAQRHLVGRGHGLVAGKVVSLSELVSNLVGRGLCLVRGVAR